MSQSGWLRGLGLGLFPVLLIGVAACTQRLMQHPGDRAELRSFDGSEENGETYAEIVANPFKLTASEPVSTFSADVNTASYSNVRRILEEGQLPPPDAVRVAEMLNYFEYDYPKPIGSDPVAIGLEYAACPWQPEHKLLKIAVKAKTLHAAELPPRNFVFLIDVSGSMGEPNKLPLVQESLRMLVEGLTEKDTVSIVTYAETAVVKLAPTRGDRKDRILKKIDSLEAGGGTNGSGGLELAYEQAEAAIEEGMVNRVIIATDGDFNIGRSTPEEMVELIKQKRKTGIYLSVLGYGIGNLKDETLEQLARHGNGHYAYIDGDAEARKVFVEQGGALVTVAKDVKLQVEFNPAKVKAYRQIGYENRVMRAEEFTDPTADAGEMGSGDAVTALYEVVPVGVDSQLPGTVELKYSTPFRPTAAAAKSPEMLRVRMAYKHPDTDEQVPPFEVTLPELGENLYPSPDFHFAAAVAEFAMLLRDSPYKGTANFDDVERLLGQGITTDPNGYKAEFAELVELARTAE